MNASARRRRTWPQRLLILCGLLVAVALFAGARFFWEARTVLADLPRIRVGAGVLAQEGAPGDPVNLLLVGVDSSEGLDPDDPVRQGRNVEDEARGVVRPDTILILRLDPATGEAAVISLPRDLIVEVPGGTTARINATQAVGGLDSLISTIDANFSIPINNFVVADFASFAEVVEIVGGVPINFPFPTRDQGSGLALDAGCWALDGSESLAYVRARSIEEFIDDQWVPLPAVSPDLVRIERQQEFMVLALEQVLAVARSDISRIGEFIDAGSQAVQLDENLTPGDMLGLAEAFADYNTDDLVVSTLPVAALFSAEGVYQGEALVEDAAIESLALFQGIAGSVRPAEVSVLVDTTEDRHVGELSERGFVAQRGERLHDSATRIVFGPDSRDEALLLARYLESVPALDVVADVGVRLDVGPDFSGIRQFPRPVGDLEPGLDQALREFEQQQDAATTTSEAPISTDGNETDETIAQGSAGSSVTTIEAGGSSALPSTPESTTTANPNVPETSVGGSSTIVRGRPPEGVSCAPTGG